MTQVESEELEFGVIDGPSSRELLGAVLLVGGLSGLIMGAILTLIAVAIF